jgi:hypothetical protein
MMVCGGKEVGRRGDCFLFRPTDDGVLPAAELEWEPIGARRCYLIVRCHSADESDWLMSRAVMIIIPTHDKLRLMHPPWPLVAPDAAGAGRMIMPPIT